MPAAFSRHLPLWSLALLVIVTACGPTTAAPAARQSGGAAPNPAAPPKALVLAIRVEPASLAAKPLASGGVALETTVRLFNATLALPDSQARALPYLAEALPQLHTDSWTVDPSGSMLTTYKLKASVTWHDGSPLSADDFVFAWNVYATPQLGLAGSAPISLMDEVSAPDDSTVMIHWKRPYAQAGELSIGFPPLPRHQMEAVFLSSPPDTLANQGFWTRDYVGLGPFRLDRWEPGSSIEGSAFDQHVLGRAKIDRVRIVFISDPNTTLANLLSGDVLLATDDSIKFEQGLVLERQWVPQGKGTVVVRPDFWRATYTQFRPELQEVPALLDLRVRKALASSVDKDSLNHGLFEDLGIMSDVPLIPPTVAYFAGTDAAVTKYPFDPKQSQSLMLEAGFTRGGDGIYVGPGGARLGPQLATNASSQNEAETSILAAGWRQAGFDVHEYVSPAAQAQDGQVRASFPGLFTFNTPLGEATLAADDSKGIPRPENRWTGNNRGGWVNAEFDRLADAFTTSLDADERVRLITQMAKVWTDDLPAIPLFFSQSPTPYASSLTGPKVAAPGAAVSWDVYLWELR